MACEILGLPHEHLKNRCCERNANTMTEERQREDVIYADVEVLPPVSDDADGSSRDSNLGEKDFNIGEKVTPTRSRDELFYDPADDDSDDHIIRTGEDVSNYLMSLRDDGDPSLTVRSFIIGTIMAALSAAVTQIYAVSS